MHPCVQASDQLKEMYRMHKARKFMIRLTPEDKTHYTLKLAASDLFKGQKDAYPGSVARPFLTTHLSKSPLFLSPTLGSLCALPL